jgi:GT2 family glycosyltransferase
VTGRLSRFRGSRGADLLDACGMRLTLSWRHLDRGSRRGDRGQFSAPQEVFGGTGAATLFRREALDDVAVDGDIFLPEFHSFREDAELAFRLRERGWKVVYEPLAVARHRRRVVPERRRRLTAEINRHSLKNRYLLRAYHQAGPNLLLTGLPALLRDVLILGYVLLLERSSLDAYRWLWRHRLEILDRRRAIQKRRTAPRWAVDRWFLVNSRPL